jgi:hypothetical protein
MDADLPVTELFAETFEAPLEFLEQVAEPVVVIKDAPGNHHTAYDDECIPEC